MSIRWTHDLCIEADQLDVGETARFNHEDCPAGEDVRRRLYLTRPHNSPNVVLAYCHNCSESGVYNMNTNHQTWRQTWSDTKQPSGAEFEIPTGMDYDWDQWPPAAQAWLIKSGCDRQLASWYGIEYHPTYDRLYLPIYNYLPGGELIGYQLRSLDKLNSPKYLTATAEDGAAYYTRLKGVASPNSGSPNYIVVVEDLMSGLRVHKAMNGQVPSIDVLVNYGIKVNLDALNDNRDATQGYVVWLDNDGTNVRERARELGRTWSMLTGKQSYIIDDKHDPKHYNVSEIRAILENTIG